MFARMPDGTPASGAPRPTTRRRWSRLQSSALQREWADTKPLVAVAFVAFLFVTIVLAESRPEVPLSGQQVPEMYGKFGQPVTPLRRQWPARASRGRCSDPPGRRGRPGCAR